MTKQTQRRFFILPTSREQALARKTALEMDIDDIFMQLKTRLSTDPAYRQWRTRALHARRLAVAELKLVKLYLSQNLAQKKTPTPSGNPPSVPRTPEKRAADERRIKVAFSLLIRDAIDGNVPPMSEPKELAKYYQEKASAQLGEGVV